MRYPSVRNPEGFNDIFPIVVGYVVLLGILVQFSDSTALQSGYVIGTIGVCSWVIWAIFQALDLSAEEDGDS